jgi:hypothetical protein
MSDERQILNSAKRSPKQVTQTHDPHVNSQQHSAEVHCDL